MLRLIITFILILSAIPHIQSQADDNSFDAADAASFTDITQEPMTSDAAASTDITQGPVTSDATAPTIVIEASTEVPGFTSPIVTNPPVQPTIQSTFGVIGSTQSPPIQTNQQTVTTQFPSTPSTTQLSIRPFYQCDFNSSCFDDPKVEINDGSEFNPTDLSVTTDPLVAPTSDVTSITAPTNNTEKCELPFRPQLDNSTELTKWNISFCINNLCPTANGQMAACASGSYGLVRHNTSVTNSSIYQSVDSTTLLRDSVGDQCLRFYYYVTIYNQENWNQAINVSTGPNNTLDSHSSIKYLQFNDMQGNKWNYAEITFTTTYPNYTLAFSFGYSPSNATSNETVYFALDNIELYDYNCSYVQNPNPTVPPSTSTPPPISITTISTTTTDGATAAPTTAKPNNLPLILGLTLGLGLPVIIFGVVVGVWFAKKRAHYSRTESFELPDKSPVSRKRSSIPDPNVF